MKKLLTIMLLTIGVAGCQQAADQVAETTPAAMTQKNMNRPVRELMSNGIVIEIKKAVELRNDRTNYTDFKNNLNVYETTMTIPEQVFTGDLQISRSLNALALNPRFETIAKHDAEFVNGHYVIKHRLKLWESDLIPKTLTYKFYSHETLSGESSATFYPDLIIPSQNEAGVTTLQSLKIKTGSYDFGVVFFENRSLLRTEGAYLRIRAQRLFADQAAVESFSAEKAREIPVSGTVGLNGGRVIIEAQQAMGDLSITMRGTDGGQGYAGLLQTASGKKGATGTAGVRAKGPCEHVGPKSVLSGDTWAAPAAIICEWTCHKPGNGGVGESGAAGNRGGNGMPGGASGLAQVIIEKELGRFTVNVESLPGYGGPGGIGSEGGLGGAGGDPGAIANGCHEGAQAGAQGARGPKGADGDKGPDGLIEESSVIIKK